MKHIASSVPASLSTNYTYVMVVDDYYNGKLQVSDRPEINVPA